MSGAAGAGPWRLRRYETLDSTSDLCRTLAEQGEPEGLAVLAGRQTRGRGRGGRAWDTPAGNLALSVLLRPAGEAAAAAHWALLAGVVFVEALTGFLPDASVLALKWPNDVLLRGRKLAGILVESALRSDQRLDWLVIGFGANLAAAPDVPGRATASVAEIVPPPAPETVVATLLDRLAAWCERYEREGLAPVLPAWRARAHPLGTMLTVRQGVATVEGAFAGLAEDGTLLLQTGGTVHRFPAGEILAGGEG
ncbi:MAG TPA: biotin--[acetyl-CoA-carboxylase] ligase [Acetobacteraceae bacterium]|nr:biotin--[acetyl-CoA-carboxylase] ligase [Acetobacteraceae bacterium]